MLWNTLFQYLKRSDKSVVWTSSEWCEDFIKLRLESETIHAHLDEIFSSGHYTHVVNCMWELSSSPERYQNAILINSYLPKIVDNYAKKYNFHFYHIGTNWVFSGIKWPYTIDAIPDDVSIYGLSKYLWEVQSQNSTTIRTSIIWIDILSQKWFMNWILGQIDGATIHGFTNVLWNGVTTLTLARIIDAMIDEKIEKQYLMHIASETVSKYEMAQLIIRTFNKDVILIPDNEKIENRTLVSYSLNTHINSYIPSLDIQIQELADFHF